MICVRWRTICACEMFAMLLVPLTTGCHAYMLNVEDVITPPGKPVTLTAHLERRSGLVTLGGLSDIEVEFLKNGEVIGRANTDPNGRAAMTCNGPPVDWAFMARAVTNGQNLSSQGRVFVWPAGRPVIAIDLDETVVESRYIDMIFTLKDPSKPVPHSRDGIAQLTDHYGIIYLSTRPRLFRDMSLDWLNRHDYPVAPLFHTDGLPAVFRQREEKFGQIERLRAAGVNLVAGIGDKGADEHAFAGQDLPCVIVRRNGYAPTTPATTCVSTWTGVPAALRAQLESGGRDAP